MAVYNLWFTIKAVTFPRKILIPDLGMLPNIYRYTMTSYLSFRHLQKFSHPKYFGDPGLRTGGVLQPGHSEHIKYTVHTSKGKVKTKIIKKKLMPEKQWTLQKLACTLRVSLMHDQQVSVSMVGGITLVIFKFWDVHVLWHDIRTELSTSLPPSSDGTSSPSPRQMFRTLITKQWLVVCLCRSSAWATDLLLEWVKASGRLIVCKVTLT